MKYSIFALTIMVLLACKTPQIAQTTIPAQPSPTPAASTLFVTWDKKMVDLGKVKKGEKRNLFFELTNTSGQEIKIDIVDACECTRVDFPRGVIVPGAKGRFEVTFDSTEKEADETIGITIVFRETDAAGNPRIESVEYKFQIEK
jgi:peptidoglycan-associated lipoprotein